MDSEYRELLLSVPGNRTYQSYDTERFLQLVTQKTRQDKVNTVTN
jgi:hypothetical protein